MVNMMRSHQAAASAMPITVRPSASHFFCRCRAFAQRNDDVFRTRIAQVQRVGVALRAVAEDCDFFLSLIRFTSQSRS